MNHRHRWKKFKGLDKRRLERSVAGALGAEFGLAVSAVVYFFWDLALNIRIGDYSIKEWIKIGVNKMWNTFCDKSEKTNECFGT